MEYFVFNFPIKFVIINMTCGKLSTKLLYQAAIKNTILSKILQKNIKHTKWHFNLYIQNLSGSTALFLKQDSSILTGCLYKVRTNLKSTRLIKLSDSTNVIKSSRSHLIQNTGQKNLVLQKNR